MCMIPLPPTSTLFPYTTLFRSLGIAGQQRHVAAEGDAQNDRAVVHVELGPCLRAGREHLDDGGPEDRKSTRLNSSHGYISYAVFCLKKKIIRTTQHVNDDRSRM